MPYRKIKLPFRYCEKCKEQLSNQARWNLETRFCKKCRSSHPGFINMDRKGRKPWNKGKKLPYIPHTSHRGENNPGWKGGISLNKEYDSRRRSWAKNVKFRDKKCIWCGSSYNLHADHIKSYSLYPELRYDLSNGRTLCWSCHKLTDSYAIPSSHQVKYRKVTGYGR